MIKKCGNCKRNYQGLCVFKSVHVQDHHSCKEFEESPERQMDMFENTSPKTIVKKKITKEVSNTVKSNLKNKGFSFE